jgi:hypothetical protein
MSSLGSLVVSLTAETAEFRTALERASSVAQKNFKSIESAAKTAASALAIGFGGMGVAGIFSKMLAEQEENQRALLRTNAILQSTGNALGLNAQSLLDKARELNMSTLQTEESIRSAQQILLTYGDISAGAFNRTLELSADLAALMGTDMAGAARVFARALSDPVERLNTLSRAGILFTQGQKDQIKTLVESNKLFEAQNLILDVAASSFGGLARREAEGYAGAQKNLVEALNESAEAFADQFNLIENATSAVRGLTSAITETTAFIIENKTALIAWAAVFTAGGLLIALPAITTAVLGFAAAVTATAAAFAANPIALAILALTAAAVPAINYINGLNKEVQGLTISASENDAEMRKLARQQAVANGTFQQNTQAVKDNKKEMEQIAAIIKRARDEYLALYLTKEDMLEVDLKQLGATKAQIAEFRALVEARRAEEEITRQLTERNERLTSTAEKYKSLKESTASPVQKLADEEARLISLQQELIDAKYDEKLVTDMIAEARMNANDQFMMGTQAAKDAVPVYKELGSAISTAFEDAVLRGANLRDMLKGIEQDIIRIITRKLVTQPLENAVSSMLGNFLPGIFGGARAIGGPVMPGRAYLVGERGPEIFMPPGSSGTIVPSERSGGAMGGVTNININVSGMNNGEDMRRGAAQIASTAAAAVQRGRRNL